VDSDRTEQDWASELWPDDGTEPDWPDGAPAGPGAPPTGAASGRPGFHGLALGLTFVVALGAGAGAVYVYKSDLAGSAPAATSPSPRTTIGPAGAGSAESVMTLGQVLAVRHDSVTLGGGPGRAISARATSATQFTGTVRSLAQVRVGDTVAAQITVTGGVATLVRLQDPASQS
jgi:hypothetical protein